MPRKDWTLLAIAEGEQPLSPVQLQKSLFLLGRNRPTTIGGDFYEFEPYHYGPFCGDVYRDADALADEGLVQISRVGPRGRAYGITETGRIAANDVRPRFDQQAVDYLRQVVFWARGLSFQELVKSIYEAYPEQRANSIFRG